jgi:cytochrome c5
MKTLAILVMSAIIVAAGLAYAASESTVHSITLPKVPTELKAGPGKDTTEKYCAICHSLDYITMQPQFPEKTWAAIVTKMIKVMGAPIPEDDAKTISTYLGKEYGSPK